MDLKSKYRATYWPAFIKSVPPAVSSIPSQPVWTIVNENSVLVDLMVDLRAYFDCKQNDVL